MKNDLLPSANQKEVQKESEGCLKKYRYRILLFLIVLGLFGVYYNYLENMNELEKMFEDFVHVYEKRYRSQQEKDHRFSIFMRNVRKHEEDEKRHNGINLGVTQFSDRTDDELKSLLVPISSSNGITQSYSLETQGKTSSTDHPAHFDWRERNHVTPIKDQGYCGSCWAFSTVATVESLNSIKRGKLISLSEQEILDCNPKYYGCSGGTTASAMEFVREIGLCTEEEYKYRAADSEKCLRTKNLTRISIDAYIFLPKNETFVANWIAKNGPVTFAMTTTRPLLFYRSGIYHPSSEDCADKSLGSHAMAIVGYGSEKGKDYWIVKNSWGKNWGENGYLRLIRGKQVCSMMDRVVAPVIN
ncbi:unnamed protein product [Caenorhabditis angaria]|uniref:Peptidase C1A papain C-terminal domain-containing protein n=1 Tax=Caenorhabditis angaria TaxID=860376 RepID=A0A9P1N9E6_9PELO|nr:unnamed protein product [Caenorhabditis angaria]